MRDQTARDMIDHLRLEIGRLQSEVSTLRMKYIWDTVRYDDFAALLDYLKLERKQIEKHVEIGPKQES